MFVPCTSSSGFVLSKCLQPSFVVSHPFTWHVWTTEQTCRVSPAPASSSNMGSLDGSLPDLEGTGFRASTMEEKITEIYLQLPLFIQNAARIENCVQTLAQTVAAQTTEITNIENCWDVTSLETNAASGSSSRDSARSSNVLGQSNGSTATGSLGSHGPGSSDDNWNTRRRLDTFTSPEDEHARSAVLLRFPCEQYHTGITNWIKNFWKNQTFQSVINPSELLQSRFCVGQTRIRNKSQMSGLCGPISRWWYPLWNWQSLLLRQNNYLGSPIQISWRPGDRKAICAFVESAGRTAQNSLPWWRWRRCIYRPSARRPLTRSQH